MSKFVPEKHDSNDFAGDNGGETRPASNWLTKVLMPFAAVVFLFREPAVWLREHVYETAVGPFWRLLGVLAALAVGIGTGYTLGWQHDVAAVKWLAVSLLAVAVTYFYAWPAAVYGLFDWLYRSSRWLWRRVDLYGGLEDHRNDVNWLSGLLVVLTAIASIVTGVGAAARVLFSLSAWLNWGTIGYLPAGVAGLAVGCLIVFVLFLILHLGKVPYCAAVAGIAAVYSLRSVTHAFVPESLFGVNINGVTYVVEFVLWMAYIFPIAHIVISNCFHGIIDLVEELLDSAYDEPVGGYREFSLHSANVLVAVAVFFLTLHFAPLVMHSVGLCYATAVFATLASYVLVGHLLLYSGVWLVALGVSALASWQTFLFCSACGFGTVASGALALVGGVFVFLIAFPALYVLFRYAAKPLLASWLRKPLVDMHKAICEEIWNAYENTYYEATPYRALFVQVLNVGVTIGTFCGGRLLGEALGLPAVLSFILADVLAVAVYLFAGKLLRANGNRLPGWIVSMAVGVYGGANVYALNTHALGHFDVNALCWSVPAGAVAALATFWFGFTVSYVLLRALLNAIRADLWLAPVLVGLFNAYERACSGGWKEFVKAYNNVRDSFRPIYADVKRSWQEAVAQFRARK